MSDPSGPDLILEWCSVLGTGTRHAFDAACRSVVGADAKPSTLLHELEVSGHIEVDWVKSGRWWIAPPVLSFVEGASGNAVLLGARSRETIRRLQGLLAEGGIEALTWVNQGPASPSAIFVGVSSVADLAAAGAAIGAEPKTTVRLEYNDALAPLDVAIDAGSSDYTASGIQAKRLNPASLWFEPCEVRFGGWKPGCYEQLSYGLRRYLFVDQAGGLHNVDRWVATHAELNRVRGLTGSIAIPLSWSPDSQSLVCDARAQLPIMWARAAVMCTGLLPLRRVLPGNHHVDEYRGVPGTTYNAIRKTLGYELQAAPVSQGGD